MCHIVSCLVNTSAVQTCRHVLEHLKQHVLSLIDEFGALHHQLPQTQITVEHCADQSAFKMTLDGLHLHERREQSCSDAKHTHKSFKLHECNIQAHSEVQL